MLATNLEVGVSELITELRNEAHRLTCYTNNPLDGLLNYAANEIETLQSRVKELEEERQRLEGVQQSLLAERMRAIPQEQYQKALGEIHKLREQLSAQQSAEPVAWLYKFKAENYLSTRVETLRIPADHLEIARRTHDSIEEIPLIATPQSVSVEQAKAIHLMTAIGDPRDSVVADSSGVRVERLSPQSLPEVK